MTRVLLLIKTLDRGGAERLLLNASRYLDRENFEYEVAYLIPDAAALAEGLREVGLPTTCLYGASGLMWVKRLRDLVRRRQFDIVHIHSPYVAVLARLALAGSSHHRLVYTEHNLWDSYRTLTRLGNAITFQLNDHVFTVSDHVRESVRLTRVLPGRKFPQLETLYHGIDPEEIPEAPDGVRGEFGIPEDAPLIGTVGSLTPKKGHSYLIKALGIVRKMIPEVRLVLVGSGPEGAALRREVRYQRLDGAVVFTGARADAVRIASAFDVFVLSSLHEGLSIALVEAMSLGKASVVTDVGGVPEVINDGSEGIVVPPKHPRLLALGIVKLLRNRDLRERMGEAAKLRAADFDIRKSVSRMEHVYHELTAHSSIGTGR